MAGKSDFAAKLLNDLHVRKERMAAAQNSSPSSAQTHASRVVHGNTGKTMKESSNQIVPYANRQTTKHWQRVKVRDLAMAIAFAFGNLAKVGASTTNNRLANFFNRFNRRSRGTHKTDLTTVSNIHTTEVSKGVQKLNQILRACSNGKELLKGAIDLEESLRMLVELQEGSQYGNNDQQNEGQLRLLDEDEDDDDAKIAEQWKLDRPTFSFDKRSTSSSQSVELEKRRISNVVAKLMGLEEITKDGDLGSKKNDPKEKVLKQSCNFPEALCRESGERQSHTVAANQVNRHQVLDRSERKKSPAVEKRRKMQASSNTELQPKRQDSKALVAAEYITHDNRTRHRLGANSTDKEETRNQEKHEKKRVLLHQEPASKREEHLEDTKEKNGQHFQRQISMAKNHPGVKKLSREESARSNVNSTKPSEKAPTKDPTNKPHQAEVPAMKEDEQVHNLSTTEPRLDMENEKRKPKDKLIEVSAKQSKRSEIPRKIDALMSTRNANANHLSRSKKHSAENNLLKNLERQRHSNNRTSKMTEEQSHDHKMVKDEKARISMNVHEQVKKHEMLQNEDDPQKTPTPDNHSDNITLISGKASDGFWTVEHHYAPEDEQEVKQRDQTIGNNIKVEYRELNTRQEQLTEPEKELKEIIVKSQTLLSTADALFKLNIPVSFLHIASEQEDYEDARNKLTLNCAKEVMKRKARRHDGGSTFSRPKIRSLDDLIRQLLKDLDTLKFYGGDASDDVAARLHKMVERDVCQRDVDVNSMWEFEWSNIRSLLGEKEDVVRDVEGWVYSGLVDEFSSDLILV